MQRPRLFIQRYASSGLVPDASLTVCWLRPQVEAMLKWCEKHEEDATFSALFLFTYVFLLRLPSEALPVKLGKGGLFRENGSLVLELAKRCVVSVPCGN